MILESTMDEPDQLCSFNELNALASFADGQDAEVPLPDISIPRSTQLMTPLLNTTGACATEYNENAQPTEDHLLKSLPPLPSPSQLPAVPDIMSYLNLTPGLSDAETIGRESSDSSSSDILHLGGLPDAPLGEFLQVDACQERRAIGISDICAISNVPSIAPEPVQLTGTKRKYRSSGRSSKKRRVSQPSKYCHICVRSRDQVPMAPCANVVSSSCRKNVCIKCFEKHHLTHEWDKAVENHVYVQRMQNGEVIKLPMDAWKCFHCRGLCRPKASCMIYGRTNRKRHLVLKQRKLDRERRQAALEPTASVVPHALIGPQALPSPSTLLVQSVQPVQPLQPLPPASSTTLEEDVAAETSLATSSENDDVLAFPPPPIDDVVPNNEKTFLRQNIDQLPEVPPAN